MSSPFFFQKREEKSLLQHSSQNCLEVFNRKNFARLKDVAASVKHFLSCTFYFLTFYVSCIYGVLYLSVVNVGDYIEAVLDRNLAENISRVLYPNDNVSLILAGRCPRASLQPQNFDRIHMLTLDSALHALLASSSLKERSFV